MCDVDVNVVVEGTQAGHAGPGRRTEVGGAGVHSGGRRAVLVEDEEILETAGPSDAPPQHVVAVFACKEPKVRVLRSGWIGGQKELCN